MYRSPCCLFHSYDLYVYLCYVCVYYIADDLKVLVRSFSCEGCACYVGNPRESFFRVRERNVLFVKVLRKLDIMIHYIYRCILYTLQLVKGYRRDMGAIAPMPLPPTRLVGLVVGGPCIAPGVRHQLR